jgi:antidote-toxin recognition MazE-like antitoxin
MPGKLKPTQPKTPWERMRARRARLRANGLRPIQHWVPDLRDPRIRAAIRREAKLLSRHRENAAIDDWLDAVTARAIGLETRR